MFLEICEFGAARFLTAPGLAWQAALLLIIEKGIRGGICHVIHRYARTNNKYMKDYGKNKESSYLKHGNLNNFYDLAMSQTLSVNDFKLVEYIPEFGETFIKNYNKESNEGYFLENEVQYSETLHNLHNDLSCLPKKMKICYTYNKFKRNIKSWISFEKSSKIFATTIYRYEHKLKKKKRRMTFRKTFSS